MRPASVNGKIGDTSSDNLLFIVAIDGLARPNLSRRE
jgi:hypothetical protein